MLALDSAQGDLAKAQASIEAWFNSGMERVSGWYKRRMQAVLLGLGLVVAVFLNVDSMKVASELYHNDVLRAAVVAQAGAVTKSDKPPAAGADNLVSLNDLNLPIGWKGGTDSWFTVLAKTVPVSILGWLLTAFAISFGAPFWFDLLNKLMVLRSTVKPQDKVVKGNSETPQSQENKPASLQGTESAAVSSTSAAVLASMDHSTFQSNEWSSGDDPQGGAI